MDFRIVWLDDVIVLIDKEKVPSLKLVVLYKIGLVLIKLDDKRVAVMLQ